MEKGKEGKNARGKYRRNYVVQRNKERKERVLQGSMEGIM